jgi:uncharacterized protein YdeI (YjbR/CyaY-like superfamily)
VAPFAVNPDHVREFKDAKAFEKWLKANHDKADEIWIKIHKKGSGLPSITALEAIDVVLSWGWIDGIRKGSDETSFLQRYTPRAKKSIWSQINRENVARLIKEGRMTKFGLAQVEAAKADGGWLRAYASIKANETPADLMAAIEAEPRALATFKTLNSTNRFALGFRVGNLKTAAGREKKIKTFVEMLKRGETIHPQKIKAD